MRTLRLLVLLALPVLGSAAFAQSPPYVLNRTLGTSSAQVLGPSPARKRLTFLNPNGTARVAVCPTISRVTGAAFNCTVNGAGSITILPYSEFTVDGYGQNGVLPSAWNGISDTPSSALTILEFE